MWHPPIAVTPEEQQRAARTHKARKFFVFLSPRRQQRLDADLQQPLAKSERPEPGGKALVDAGLVALATRVQTSGNVSARDAVECTVMAQRGQRGRDGLGAEHPPCSRGTLFHFRLRLIEFTPTRLAFEIARTDHKYVEVTYELDAKRFGEVQRIVHIVFGVQG
jgi:hypothetical protein